MSLPTLTADQLRYWADYQDNPKLKRPFGPNPAAATDLLEASTNLVGAIRILENLSAEGKDTDDAWSEVVSELLETQAVIAKARPE